MRKKAGLKPKDKISILYSGEAGLNEIIVKNKKFIIEETLAQNLSFSKNIRSSLPFAAARVLKGPKIELETGKEIEIDGIKLWLALRPKNDRIKKGD